MPNILYNKETGAAEQLMDAAAAQTALAAGTHEVPLVAPDGSIGSADAQTASKLVAQGYKQPDNSQLSMELRHAEYDSPAKIAQATALGAAEGALGPIGTAAAKLVTTDENINALKEENPVAHGVGQAAGLVGTTLAGVGSGALLTKIGASVETALGATTAVGKIGSAAARAAAENAIFQAGDELSRGITQDPNQDIESAIAHVGLSAVLGGGAGAAFGAVPELWKMGPGKKVDELLTLFKNKSEGMPTAIKDLNMELAPEIQSVFADSPKGQQMAAELMDSGTKSGEQLRASVTKVKQQIDEAAPELIGRTSREIDDLHSNSKYETGTEVQGKLKQVIKDQVEPIEVKFDDFKGKFAQELDGNNRVALETDLAKVADNLGIDKAPSSAAAKIYKNIVSELPLQKTTADLQKVMQRLASEHGFDSPEYFAAKQIRAAIENSIEDIVEQRVQVGAPQLLDDYRATRAAYGQFKELLSDLNDRLRLGKKAEGGKVSFLSNLSDLNPEKVMDRLNLKNDVGLQKLLAEKFPEVAEIAKKETLNALLKKSLGKEGGIDTTKFLKQVKELSPELRNYILGEETQKRLGALGDLMQRLPTGANSSRTATVLDKMYSAMPASAAGMLAWVTGNNPIVGAILGQLARYVSREAPDAMKLAMLKYIGSGQPLSSAGLKAAVESAAATIKGEAVLGKAAKAVYKGTMPVIAQPSVAEREILKKRMEHLNANRDDAMGIGGEIGHYLPEHGSALGLSSVRAVTYLLSLKPNVAPATLLDKPRVPTKAEEAKYNRALDLAQAPLLIMSDIKNGKVTEQDLQHLNALYPSLAKNIAQKLQTEMIEAVHNGVEIPYRTKLALSMVLRMPLESSISAANIVAAQPPPPTPPGTNSIPAAKMSGLKKLPGLSGTSQQSRELHRMSTSGNGR